LLGADCSKREGRDDSWSAKLLDLDTLQLRAVVDLMRALGCAWEDSVKGRSGNAMDTKQHA
jgi:hypothetical protein